MLEKGKQASAKKESPAWWPLISASSLDLVSKILFSPKVSKEVAAHMKDGQAQMQDQNFLMAQNCDPQLLPQLLTIIILVLHTASKVSYISYKGALLHPT